jgi:D-alanyl-D-alanine carboxypeptidase/D-alanyl-D-alanine-endopeptidase (penicillin-binding protein 4)
VDEGDIRFVHKGCRRDARGVGTRRLFSLPAFLARKPKVWLSSVVAAAAALVAFSVSAGLPADPLEPFLAREVERARAAAPELSVHVVDLEEDRSVYGFNSDQKLIVGSNAKLFTTAAALENLGPGFFFETRLLVRGRIAGGHLDGNLAVVGSGDPNISGRHHDDDPLAVFRRWAHELRALGIEAIDGDIYLVHGLFDDDRIHPDWPRDQLSKWYEAPVDALSFNDNCVLVKVSPGNGVGKPARVEMVPALDLFDLENLASTTASIRRHLVAVERVEGRNRIRVSGLVYRAAEPIEAWVTVGDPVEYFGAALLKALEDEGIETEGRPRAVTKLPLGPWWRVVNHRSDLLTTLQVTNRESQNLYAESLIKTLGAKLCSNGSWEAGRAVVADFLRRIGISSGYRLADGSGMSRNNLFSAKHLTRLLGYMYDHPWQQEFLVTLPFSGDEDHSRWRTRLAKEPYRASVLAKTGSLRGVSTLSGYARARSGRVYAFSILCNRVKSIWHARRAQDRIVMALIDRG